MCVVCIYSGFVYSLTLLFVQAVFDKCDWRVRKKVKAMNTAIEKLVITLNKTHVDLCARHDARPNWKLITVTSMLGNAFHHEAVCAQTTESMKQLEALTKDTAKFNRKVCELAKKIFERRLVLCEADTAMRAVKQVKGRGGK